MKLILIVDDKVIMDMSKIESGQMDFKYSDVNLSDIFQNLAYTFRFKIKEGVHLSLVLPREPFILHTEKKTADTSPVQFQIHLRRFHNGRI